MLSNAESWDVDFKANAKVEAEDLVAFANSPDGGRLLLGVEEVTVDGVQRGKVVGCRVDDEARLAIVNKAAACIPPVTVSVDVEWEGDQAFFSVTIPSGTDKPYCTANGTYKIRGDGRNVPLVPSSLLNLLLEREGGRFLGRFREATADLEREITELRSRLAEVPPLDGRERQSGHDPEGETASAVCYAAAELRQLVRELTALTASSDLAARLARLEAGLRALQEQVQ